jgi:hypothetical protein
MKIHKGDVIEISITPTYQFLIKLNGYFQPEYDHEYIFKRCGITWQEAAISLKIVPQLTFTI